MNIMRKAVFLILSIQISWPSWAADSDAFQFFQEEAKVITASRTEQPIEEAPVAVEVITPEEIKTSGVTNLWDLMRFRPGMDVLDGRTRVDNRALVSVRGFAERFTRNLLVLVDNRSVYATDTGGVFWDRSEERRVG